jgi:hypothetical protein
MKKSTCLFRGLTGALLGATLLFNSGCFVVAVAAVGAAAAGTVAYVDGKLEVTLVSRYDAMVSATRVAITQLDYAKPVERQDALSDTFTTHAAKGDEVQIVVTRVSDTATKVSIRVGIFGDKVMSQAILDKIKANL